MIDVMDKTIVPVVEDRLAPAHSCGIGQVADEIRDAVAIIAQALGEPVPDKDATALLQFAGPKSVRTS